MGILDDAIREHLELKRQHGVPAEEVERQEEEALGPARREVAPTQPQDTADADQPAVDEPVAEEHDEAVEEPQAALEPEPEPEPVPEPEEPEPAPEPEAPPEPEPDPDPEPAAVALPSLEERPAPAGDTPPRGVEPVDEEHEEHAQEEHEEQEEQEDGEDPDVLQDTPDFLQETPEHDRLWFEQKPPRDFDFD